MADVHYIASRFPLEKCTLQESWLLLTELLHRGELPICEATRYISSTVGKVADELLPLPVPPDPPAAHTIGVALATGISLVDLRQQFKRDWACTCRHRWTTLVITALNLMHGGLSNVRATHAPAPWSTRSEAQEKSVALVAQDVEVFLLEGTTTFPALDWAALQRSLKTSYSGDVVLRGQALEWERMEPGLPPLGLAGSVDSLALAAPGMRRFLSDPALSVLPKEQWPSPLPEARVRVSQGHWERVLNGLHARGIVEFLPDSSLVVHKGQRLLNGLFAVPKGDLLDAKFCPCNCPQRTIVNAVPSNSVQQQIRGEITDLPLHTLWHSWEVAEHESILWSSEDQSSAFYLFSLPKPWLPYFVIGRKREHHIEKVAADLVWPAIRVIPMGWTSSCGVFQHLACQLQRRARERCTELAPAMLGRETPLSTEQDGRLKEFMQIYLDNWDEARALPREDAAAMKARTSQFQQILQEVYREWNVARSEHKAVTSELKAKTLGAVLRCTEARALPSTDKAIKVISLFCYGLRQKRWTTCTLGTLLGQLCFMVQFRRPCFTVLNLCWEAVSQPADGALQTATTTELLLALALLPLMQIDARQDVSPVLTASDASEIGAGVTYSTELTEAGRTRLDAQLFKGPTVYDGAVILLESFAGLSSARVALSILGVRPALHIVAESDPYCLRVIRHWWPDAHVFTSVEAVTEAALNPILSGAPQAKLLIHTAGSPCPGFCRWNPFRLQADSQQLKDSLRLFYEVIRINKVLKRIVPHMRVATMEENVCSMTSEQRDFLSAELKEEPVKCSLADHTDQRRERYFWMNWKCSVREEVSIEQRPGFKRVRLLPMAKQPERLWISPGWRRAHPESPFPTLTRPCAVAKPRWRTPGVDTADEATLQRWMADSHRRPPAHYTKAVMLVDSSGRKRFKEPEEDERLHGYPRHYTWCCYNGQERRRDPAGFRDRRGMLLGNCFSPLVVAYLLSEVLFAEKLIAKPVPVTQLAAERTCIHLSPRHCPSRDGAHLSPRRSPSREVAGESGQTELSMKRMMRHLMGFQSARGNEIRAVSSRTQARLSWQDLPSEYFVWRDCLSVPWKSRTRINVAEGRARQLCARWRARCAKELNTRHIHMMDSQCTLANAAKGRTGSLAQRHVLLRTSAVLLAGHMRDIVA